MNEKIETRGRKEKLTPLETAAALETWKNTKLTQLEVAKKYGISLRTMSRIVRRHKQKKKKE